MSRHLKALGIAALFVLVVIGGVAVITLSPKVAVTAILLGFALLVGYAVTA